MVKSGNLTDNSSMLIIRLNRSNHTNLNLVAGFWVWIPCRDHSTWQRKSSTMQRRLLLVRWFQTFVIFHNIWDNPSHWLSYFSRWLKPPTSCYLVRLVEHWYPPVLSNMAGKFTISSSFCHQSPCHVGSFPSYKPCGGFHSWVKMDGL